MTPKISELLNSRDPSDRKRAIKLMAQSADPAAFPYLAALYKTDPDPDVRALAVQAGRYIKKQQESHAWGDKPQDSAPATSAPASKPSFDFDSVKVSEGDRRRSEEMMDRALDLDVANDKAGAKELAKKAVKLNPLLVKDAYYGGIISSITEGLKGEDALIYLLGESKSTPTPSMAGDKPKRKNDDPPPATAGDAVLSLVVLWLMITGLAVAMSLLLPTLIRPALERFLEAANAVGAGTAIDPADFGAVFAITGADVTASLIAGVLIGLQFLIVTLVTYVIYHVVALFMLAGDGSFFGLIINATPYQIVLNLFSYGVGFAMIYLYFNGLLNATTDLLLGQLDQDGYAVALANATSPLLGAVGISVLFGFVMLIWLSNIIGNTYQFGTFKGCMTLVLSVGVMIAIGCGLYFLAGAAIMGALQSITPDTLPTGGGFF